MNKEELTNIYGGAGISAAFISAVVKAITTIYDMGKRLGTSIIRSKTNKLCPL